MGDWTKVNLNDVEDKAKGFGMSPQLQSRFARQDLGCREGGLGLFRLEPGFRLPFGHRHREQEEIYVLLRGNARMKLEDEIVDLRPLDAVRVAGPVMRGLEAGDEGAEVLVFGAPDTGNADAEMVRGWWTD